ncbi:MAG: hypothetical protein AB8G15_23140 [Saprospiraceae bacterium]
MRLIFLSFVILFLSVPVAHGQWTYPSSSTISTADKVGIGIEVPSRQLQVKGGLLDPHLLFELESGSNLGSLMRIRASKFNDNWDIGISAFTLTANQGFNAIPTLDLQRFVIKNNNQERFSINASGNVGVGIGYPQQKLHVNGNLRVEDRKIFLGSKQSIYADNNARVHLTSNNTGITGLRLVDKLGRRHGELYGSSGGKYFGLLDGDGQWSYFAAKDNYTSFRINNSEKFRINKNGQLLIGTTTAPSSYKLAIKGQMIAEGMRIRTYSNWADYVFEENYPLLSLEELEAQIKIQKHLPGIPSAKEVATEGIDVGEMQAKLLEKVEELTLYLIEQNKLIQQQQVQIDALKQQVK